MAFADLALVRRIEAQSRALCVEVAEAARADGDARATWWPLAGGAAVYAGPDSPCNKLVGLELDRVPDERELATIERALFERGASVRAEVPALSPATASLLAARGYRLTGFENVLGRALDDSIAELPARHDGAFAIEECTPADHDAWIDALVTGFSHPDPIGPHEEFPRDVLARIFAQLARTGGFGRWLARTGDAIAGAASLRIGAGLAQLCGTATLPAMRGRGIQTALVHRRLAHARTAGCDVAVVTTVPGSQSELNLARAGFALLYTRVVLERDASG